MKHSLPFEKFLLNFCLLFLVLFNIPILQSQTSSCGWTISSNTYFTFSNSTNTQTWNGTSWVSALEITCTAADAVWLTALFPVTTRFWEPLYNNGACWVSIPSWDSAISNFSRKFKQIVTPSVNLTNVRIDFCVDDSLAVFLDGTYIGSGSHFNRLNSVNLGNLSATTHEISFEVFNTRPLYFGFIYGIRGDTARSECEWPITRFDYCIDSSSGRYLVSNSSNVKMWSGTNWFAAVDVPSTTADGIWGAGLGILPPYPWYPLYDNGACWISRNASGLAVRAPDTLYFRHSFTLGGSTCTLHRLTVDFCVDDTVNIYYNHTGAFAPPGGTLVGSGSQYAAVNSVSFFVIGNNVTIDFEVISTRASYIGLIYGIRCEEIPFTCDSIRINITRASPAEDTSGCCYQFNIFNPFPSSLPINTINFVTVAPNSISSAVGPAGWTLVNPLPNTLARFNDVSLQPGNNIFTLCFTGSNPTCTVYLYFYNQCDCKYPFDLYCQNCCDSFRTNIRSSVYQISSQYILLTTTFNNILPNPNLVRVLSYVAYAKRGPYFPNNMFFDLWRAKSTYGTPPSWSSWQPPSTPPGTQLGRQITFPAFGLSGIWGTHRTQPGFSRELIWGDYDLRNSTQIGVINGYSFRAIFKLPPVAGPYEFVNFGIRYMFTDTSCCTCDTLIASSFGRKRTIDPVPSTIILDSEEKGNITILKRNPIDPEDSMFVPRRYDFQCEIKDAAILQIRDLSNGTIFLPDENGICKATPILQNDSGLLEIHLSNPKKLNRIPLKVTEILLFEGDSIPMDYQIIALHKTTGDELTIYDDGKPKNPQIVMVLLKNNNTFKENISHIIIKPKNNEKLIAVGSDAINLKAQMGIYAPQEKEEGLKILPEAFTDSESSELEPQQEIKPIYLVFEPDNDKNAEFIFETYNKNNEIIAEGTINIPVTAVQDIDTKNELISNLTISPNPSSDYISISFFSSDILQNVAFNIYDLGGKFIGTIHNYNFIPIGINSILYSVASLPSGTYILQIKGNEFELTTTFVITR